MIAKRNLFLFTLLLLLGFPTTASNLGKGTVTGVFPRASAQETYISFTGTANTTCTLKDYVVLKKSNLMSDDLFATLLLAFTMQSPNVSILVEGCDGNNRAIIDGVVLE